MYLLRPDLDGLVEWLNAESAVAWTVPDGGPGRWKAVPTVSSEWVVSKWRSGLWFVDSPLVTGSLAGPGTVVADPFAGWAEAPSAAGIFGELPGGATTTSLFRLEQQVEIDPKWGISRSALQWIGGHHSILGHKPADHEAKWWQRMRRHVKRLAEPRTVGRQTQWVFPAAAEAVASGVPFSKWG